MSLSLTHPAGHPAGHRPDRAEVLLSLRQLHAATPEELERLATWDRLDWALLDSYLRIGCGVRGALLAVAGEVLLLSLEPGAGPDAAADARGLLDHFALAADEVLEALGLPAA